MKVLNKLRQLFGKNSTPKKATKGNFVVYVGEEQKRYVVPLKCLSSKVFQLLLHQFEDHIHYRGDGKIVLPCSIDVFEWVLDFAKFY